jgi:cell division septal protein FtsQ
MSRKKKKKAQKNSEEDAAASWHKIDQSSKPEPEVKPPFINTLWERLGSKLMLIIGVLFFAGIVYFGTTGKLWEQKRFSEPLNQIVFETNGILTWKELRDYLGLVESNNLMEVNIQALKKQIEKVDQIKSIMIARKFPDTLKIQIQEHVPILRVAFKEEDGEGRFIQKHLLISREGYIFKEDFFSASQLKPLLYLSGVTLRPTRNGYSPIEGMEVVEELLQTAQRVVPHLYSNWRAISCKHFSQDLEKPGNVIEVETRNVGRIVFMPSDFETQLIRLDYILRQAAKKGAIAIQRIDLSLPDQAAVRVSNRSISTVKPNQKSNRSAL